MNQTFSITAFVTGLVTFLGVTSEMFSLHHAWGEFVSTPGGASHLLIIGASFVSMLGGAIGIQLPRSPTGHGDRATDSIPASPGVVVAPAVPVAPLPPVPQTAPPPPPAPAPVGTPPPVPPFPR